MRKIIICTVCGEEKELCGKGMCKKCYFKNWHKENSEYSKKYYEENFERIRKYNRNWKYEHGVLPMSENKNCSSFLGVHIAEQVLSKVFKNVQQMPPNNPGFDFKCNRGMKVDVKSSTLHKNKKYINRQGSWTFHINKNTIADYFLCLAFDNREDLNPMHIWLIPGEVLNHLTGAKISKSKMSKWKDYELNINKVITCCDTMRN